MVRRVLTAMACSAVMLAVGIPGVAQGAKEAERPSGKALVRIDGGTAYAKDLGKGKYQRRDFRYDSLTQRAAWESEGSLFEDLGRDLFTPAQTYPPMTVHQIVGAAS